MYIVSCGPNQSVIPQNNNTSPPNYNTPNQNNTPQQNNNSTSQNLKNIDLGIQNITQLTSNWCWAAVSEQIINWLKGNSPNQCQLVAMAYNASPDYCCLYPQSCNTPGSLQQIQTLIYYYGGRYSSITPPANEIAIYNTLSQGKAIILFIKSSPYQSIGHFVVLRGINWMPNLNGGYSAQLLINDPMSYFIQPILFNDLMYYWQAAIVVN